MFIEPCHVIFQTGSKPESVVGTEGAEVEGLEVRDLPNMIKYIHKKVFKNIDKSILILSQAERKFTIECKNVMH